MTRVKVAVTQSHIVDGSRTNASTCCPIALAVRGMGYERASVAANYVNLKTGQRQHLPRSAQRFIQRFDNCKKVNPFNFFLDVQ